MPESSVCLRQLSAVAGHAFGGSATLRGSRCARQVGALQAALEAQAHVLARAGSPLRACLPHCASPPRSPRTPRGRAAQRAAGAALGVASGVGGRALSGACRGRCSHAQPAQAFKLAAEGAADASGPCPACGFHGACAHTCSATCGPTDYSEQPQGRMMAGQRESAEPEFKGEQAATHAQPQGCRTAGMQEDAEVEARAAHAEAHAQPRGCAEAGQRHVALPGAECSEEGCALRAKLRVLQQSQGALEEARAAARCALQPRTVLQPEHLL